MFLVTSAIFHHEDTKITKKRGAVAPLVDRVSELTVPATPVR